MKVFGVARMCKQPHLCVRASADKRAFAAYARRPVSRVNVFCVSCSEIIIDKYGNEVVVHHGADANTTRW